jgi:UDP-N-acetylglucosamine 2-epimerase (non-hydrolysing)
MLISCVVGTRPEVVKMAPVILRLRRGGLEDVRVLATGQHRSLLDQALFDFGLAADDDLDLMRPDQKLADLSARALSALSQLFEKQRPGLVLAQGDTSTVFCAALACYYNRIPFAHVEAGLRTGRRYFPFPEEMNRILTGQLAEESIRRVSMSPATP